jgi:hypothetical protein
MDYPFPGYTQIGMPNGERIGNGPTGGISAGDADYRDVAGCQGPRFQGVILFKVRRNFSSSHVIGGLDPRFLTRRDACDDN